MKISGKAALLALSLSLFSLPVFADNVLTVPEQGLVLHGAAKQEYMKDYMQKMFHPAVKKAPQAFVMPEGWVRQDFALPTCQVEHFHKTDATNQRALIYFHGGGYVNHAGNGHRLISIKEAELFGASDVYMPDYRLAPQYTHPAALEDGYATYQKVLAQGFKPEQIVFVGDSAGGNLAVALPLYLRQQHQPQPAAVIAVSPWATLEHQKGTSRYFNVDRDIVLGNGTPLYKPVIAAAYAGKTSKKDPLLSPMYADFTGVAPLLIQTGSTELFLTESVALAEQVAKSDTEVTLTVYSGMPHDFALLMPKLQESINSLKEMQAFVKRYIN